MLIKIQLEIEQDKHVIRGGYGFTVYIIFKVPHKQGPFSQFLNPLKTFKGTSRRP